VQPQEYFFAKYLINVLILRNITLKDIYEEYGRNIDFKFQVVYVSGLPLDALGIPHGSEVCELLLFFFLQCKKNFPCNFLEPGPKT